jgi:hypothetical protein
MEHAYTFLATFEDGTVISEYDGDTQKHAFQAVLDKRYGTELTNLMLMPTNPEKPPIIMGPKWGPWTPVFFRRNFVSVGEGASVDPVTCIGWKKKYAGMVVESLMFVFSDGSILHTDDRNSV